MIVTITSVEVAGARIPCHVQIDLDECEVYFEVWNQVDDRKSQRVNLPLKREIEAQLRITKES